jgi:hypothetical protein
MEPLTVVAAVVRRHPVTAPYVLVSTIIVLLLGTHPW